MSPTFSSRARRGSITAISGAISAPLAALAMSAGATVSGGGAFIPIHASAGKYDEFAYANDAALRSSSKYNQTETLDSRIFLDTSVTYNGHPTARVDQPNATSGINKLVVDFTSGQGAGWWFRIPIKYSPGWTTAGSAATANSWKMFGWGWYGADGRGDLEITSTTTYQLHHDASHAGGTFTSLNIGTFDEEADGDSWWDYTVYYRQTGNGAPVTKAWIGRDGATPTLMGTIVGDADLNANGIGFPFYYNQTRNSSQSLWIGNWQVVFTTAHVDPWGLL